MTASLTTTWQRVSLLGVNTMMPFYLVQKRIVFNQTMIGIIGLSLLHLAFFIYTLNGNWLPLLIPVVSIASSVFALWLMHVKRFKWATTVLFSLFPVLTIAYAVVTGMAVLYIAHFIFLVLAFYLLRSNRSTAIVSAFIFACFISGYGYELIATQTLTAKLLFFATCLFALCFVVLHGIRKQVCRYEATLKANNISLQKARDSVQLQKTALEQQALLLEQQTTALTELNEVKTRLFSILSHDLRGHVHAIYNAVQVSNDSEEGRAFLMQNLSALEKDAGDARNLLEGILGWSKTLLHSAQPVVEPFDLGHLVKGVVKFYEATANKKAVLFQVQMERKLTVNCDRNMMETVFRNLINNAIKFSRGGGLVIVNGRLEGNCVAISITNQGQEMELQVLKRITEAELNPSSSLTGANNGIGLILTKELLQKNQGSLHINSKQGADTTLVVQIPHVSAFSTSPEPLCSN